MNWTNPNYLPWLIPIPPLVAFALIILAAGRSRFTSHVIAITAIVLSWLMSFSVFLSAVKAGGLGSAATDVFHSGVTWLSNGTQAPGLDATGGLTMGVMVDPLTAIMLFMVPLACLLIFIYAIGYMAHDPRNTRFFAYLSLFAGAMLTLVIADNLLLLFVGWEVMGLCSYLLIGFWYEKPSAYKAAMKAFLTTRVGDVIMMIGIAYLWATTGTLNFRAILYNSDMLHRLAATPAIGGFLGLTTAGLIGICIVAGTIGKSAQFPLHVWLPDAMEGPTPVSAMIHAAAMVSAGVYLVIRMYPLLSAGGNPEAGQLTAPLVLMAVVGSFTALFAATIAIAQNDIKKVLAYSTISQLGFMIAALGIGAYTAAAFHLITHAFFKALLFLSSGSVIHAMEHGEHATHGAHSEHEAHAVPNVTPPHEPAHGEAVHAEPNPEHEVDPHALPAHPPEAAFDPQDMRTMGGLWQRIPVTAVCFVIGGAALTGLPLVTAGFWSKDEIFADAFKQSSVTPIALLVLFMLALAAILTTLYTFRQIWMTFFGAPRSEAAQHAQINDGTVEGRNISIQMQAPLTVLAFFAIFAGFIGVSRGFPLLGPALAGIHIDEPFLHFVGLTLIEPVQASPFVIWPVAISFTVFLLGLGAGIYLYVQRPIVLGQDDALVSVVGPDVYRVLVNKYYVDEFYAAYLIRPVKWLADEFASKIIDQGIIDVFLMSITRAAVWIGNLFREFNRVVIDGVGDGIPEALSDAARGLRPMQTGRIQQYLLYSLIAAIVVGLHLVLLILAPTLIIIAVFIAEIVIIVSLVFVFGTGGTTPTNKPRDPSETRISGD